MLRVGIWKQEKSGVEKIGEDPFPSLVSFSQENTIFIPYFFIYFKNGHNMKSVVKVYSFNSDSSNNH